MGVAGLMFEPHPPYFEDFYNFLRCSNDIKTIFWYLYWFQIFKNAVRQCSVHSCSCPCPTTFGNIRVICCTRSLFSISWKGDGRWSLRYVKIPILKQLLCFLKDDRAWSDSIQTARSICPFYPLKMQFLLPWLQNRLQTISSKKFSMLKKKL